MTTDPVGFNYGLLQGKVRQATERHAKAIHALVRQTTAAVVDIGRRLHDVRETLDDRTWDAWLRAEFRWSKTTASNYIQVSETFGHLDCLERFQHSALYALVRRNVDALAVQAAVKEAESGATITRKRAFDLISKFAPRGQSGPKPAAMYGLRQAIQQSSSNVDALLKSCTPDELNGTADELLQLAVQLRTAMQTTPAVAVQPGPARPSATPRRRRRKRETSAA